eukprot:1383356-Amphidinium_carterae.3
MFGVSGNLVQCSGHKLGSNWLGKGSVDDRGNSGKEPRRSKTSGTESRHRTGQGKKPNPGQHDVALLQSLSQNIASKGGTHFHTKEFSNHEKAKHFEESRKSCPNFCPPLVCTDRDNVKSRPCLFP